MSIQHPILYLIDGNRSDAEPVITMAQSMGLKYQLFETAEDLLKLNPQEIHGILVSEFRLLGTNGIDLHQKLMQRGSNLQTIFYTCFAETWLVVEAMRGGALTVMDKTAREHEIFDAITLGIKRYNEELKTKETQKIIDARFATLSIRETQVLDLLLEGLPNKIAAKKLDISVRTIEACRHNIFEKTHTECIAQLVRLAIRAKLIS